MSALPDHFLNDRVTDALDELESLDDEQRAAVKVAFKLWVDVATHHDYQPIRDWGNFAAEVDHSALLRRLLEGKPPLREKPRTEHSYPVYPDEARG